MNENYFKLGQKQLESLNGKKRILLHSCCAPCSSHVISYLTKYFDITILYYNPNISPRSEYEKRKEEQIRLIKEIDKENNIDIIDCDYDNDIYESRIKGFEDCPERGNRCTICFDLRLSKTAELAKQMNYDYFCSTLSVSPYKNSKLLNELGKKMENIYGVTWLYSDFKKENGYKHSIELSKKYNLYRQDYCGCKYSVRNKLLD
jgi:predicted adenine nucleotide alpha hydrolase (AANH) superfamily ATPase